MGRPEVGQSPPSLPDTRFGRGPPLPGGPLGRHRHENRADQKTLPRLLRLEGPSRRPELAARSAERPDADVHERRHGAVQGRLHRQGRARYRAPSSQKCIRISGKHNDLENVGRTARHHTFFEMLGNFSFGDYFKEDAIAFAWELLTTVLAISEGDRSGRHRFGGDGASPRRRRGAAHLAQGDRLRRRPHHRARSGDNFWQMGETGPAVRAPRSISHGDGPGRPGGRSERAATPTATGWIEIWNLVFMQFERSTEGGAPKLTPLPAPCIDTGAGLERLAGALMRVPQLRHRPSSPAHRTGSRRPARSPRQHGRAATSRMRVIADHARAAAFLIAEGVMPDRTGREYVLRRVMRRAIRHGHDSAIRATLLARGRARGGWPMGGHTASFASARSPSPRHRAGRSALPPDHRPRALRSSTRSSQAAGERGTMLSGEAAFKLYDTYGFPVDLRPTSRAPRGSRRSRGASRRPWSGQRERAVPRVSSDGRYRQRHGSGGDQFTGYGETSGGPRHRAHPRRRLVSEIASAGEPVRMVLDQHAVLRRERRPGRRPRRDSAGGLRFRVDDTQTNGDAHVHIGVCDGSVTVGADREAYHRQRAARRDPTQPLGDPPLALGLAHGARAPCPAERIGGGAGSPALRFHPLRGDQTRVVLRLRPESCGNPAPTVAAGCSRSQSLSLVVPIGPIRSPPA